MAADARQEVWLNKLELPPTADFHVHLRDGAMMELVVPTIQDGGCDTVYVMVRSELVLRCGCPLAPPIT